MPAVSEQAIAVAGLIRRWSQWLDRRRHARVFHALLVLRIHGRTYKTMDWSLGGARIAGYSIPVSPGDIVSGSINSVGGEAPGTFTAEVVRRNDVGEIGIRFLEISGLTLLAMEGLIRS